MLQPYVKLLYISFFHINLHSIHQNGKANTELLQLCKFIYKKKKLKLVHCTSIQILNSVLSWSTSIFGYDATSFAHQHFAIICHSSPLKLCQVGWGQTHIFRFLQKYLIGFNPRLWLGHSRTFTELSISHSCCVLRVIVLLEVEPSVQSEVLNALD